MRNLNHKNVKMKCYLYHVRKIGTVRKRKKKEMEYNEEKWNA